MREIPLTEFIGREEKKKAEEKETLRREQKDVKGLWKLPEGWKWVRLGDIFTIQQGVSLSPKRRKGKNPLPFLRTKNVKWGYVDVSELDYMDFTPEEVEKLKLKPGDLLVLEGGEIGRTAIWRGELEVCLYQNHIHRLRKKADNVLPEFYMYWMMAAYTVYNSYNQEGVRTAIPNLSKSRLASFKVPFPPLEEQKRIVKKLDEIRSRIEEARRLAREAKEQAEKLITSALHEIFSKAEERGWEWRHFDEIVDLKAKFKVGKLKKSEYQNEGLLPVIDQGENFIAGYTNNVELKYSGPLPVVIFGDHTTNVKYVDFPFVVGADGVKILVPKSDVYPKYLYYMLLKFKPKQEGYKRHFSKLKDKDRVYPVPPLEEQKRIVAYLDAISERARQLVKLYEEMEKELEKLWFSALDKAFKGKL